MLNATLVGKKEITADLIVFKVKPDAGIPDFKPGQYVAVGLQGKAPRSAGSLPDKEPQDPEKFIKRAYSIGSSPADKEGFEFFISIVPDGALSPRLRALNVGDRLHCAPKVTGTFVLDEVAPQKNLIFVSTGTGLAPFIAMLRTESIWTGRGVTLIHTVRHSRDLGYDQELKSLAAARPQFRYHPTVTREDPTWKGHRGRAQTLVEGGLVEVNTGTDHVFLCGNPAMIDDFEKLLVGRGFSVHSRKTPGNLHLEKYW